MIKNIKFVLRQMSLSLPYLCIVIVFSVPRYVLFAVITMQVRVYDRFVEP